MIIQLPKEVESSIRKAVQSGQFASIDEAMTQAARLLLRQAKRAKPAEARTEDEVLRQMHADGLITRLPARITEVEMTSAVARRRRGGSLTAARVRSILTRFRSQLAGRYIAVEITPALLADAVRLANAHALRADDAVQLAPALEVNGRYQ